MTERTSNDRPAPIKRDPNVGRRLGVTMAAPFVAPSRQLEEELLVAAALEQAGPVPWLECALGEGSAESAELRV